MTTAEDKHDHPNGVNGFDIDASKIEMNGMTGCSAPNTPLLNGLSSSINGDNKTGILERRASKLEPLKEVTNTNNGLTTPAASEHPASSKSATMSNGFKIPPLPSVHKA